MTWYVSVVDGHVAQISKKKQFYVYEKNFFLKKNVCSKFDKWILKTVTEFS